MIYFILIAGTPKWDCKWFFDSKENLNRFLSRLPLKEVIIEKQVKDEDESIQLSGSLDILKDNDAFKYWENHITILKIDPKSLRRYHKYFKAAYWDDSVRCVY